MATGFKTAADAVLNRVVTSEPRVPGVVAMWSPTPSATSTKVPPARAGWTETRT
jgi:hypothetical protein